MKNNRMFIYGAGTLLVLAVFVGCGGRSGESEFNKAMKAWEKGNLVQARTLFEKSTARLSGNDKKSLAFNNLGLVLWQLDEPESAANAFSDACTLSETITDARLNLAMAEFHSGRIDDAKLSLGMYLGENPDSKPALALQSLVAAQQRDWAKASRILYKSAAADPRDAAIQNALALAEAKGGQNPAPAVTRLKQLIIAHPDYAPALYNLAVIHDRILNDKTAALSYYRGYLKKAGDDGSHVANAQQAIALLSGQSSGTAASSRGNPADAQQFLKEGDRLFSEKKYAEAFAQYRNAANADPSLKEAYYREGLASFYQANYDTVQKVCRQALTIEPSYADARYLIAYSYLQQQKWEDAEREARELVKVDPKRGESMLKHIADERK